MDFTVELDDDEVLTLTVDDAPKKRVRIQVESLTVRGRFSDRKFVTVGALRGILHEKACSQGQDPEWLKNDFCAVVLAHMRDDPKHKVSRDAAARLEASDFPANRYALMFRAIRSLMVKREKVTPVSVSEEARSIDPDLALPAWFVDSVGGDNDDVDAESSLEWILSRRIIAER